MIISELFRSIQGESSFAGLPCTFIRTAGCSLRCSYCDTDYALSKKSGVEMELDEVLARVRHLGMDLVELTGGEPLEQEETRNCVNDCYARAQRFLSKPVGINE